jgi:hypothetical protein
MRAGVQALVYLRPEIPWFTNILVPGSHGRTYPSSVSGHTWPIWNHRVPRAPLPCLDVIQARDDFHSHLGRHYSSFLARTGSCVRPCPSPRLVFLVRGVLAGCHQSLRGDGPSRHDLCNPCVGAGTPTPPCPPGASAHFFPGSLGLTPRETRSAHESIPALQLPQGAVFRGYSHSFIFRLLHSLGLQIAPTAKHTARGGQAVYTTHRLAGYPFQDVASLRVRHGQLTRRDLHPLDCSLVGCSGPHPVPHRFLGWPSGHHKRFPLRLCSWAFSFLKLTVSHIGFVSHAGISASGVFVVTPAGGAWSVASVKCEVGSAGWPLETSDFKPEISVNLS